MPDLLASASLLPLTPAIPPRVASVAVPAAADFMAMLGNLVVAPDGKSQGGKGQAVAADGKNLPVADEDAEAGDPVIAWLPTGLVPLQPLDPAPLPGVALVTPSPVGVETGAVMLPAGEAASIVLPEATRPIPPAETAAAPIAMVEATPAGPAPVEPTIVTGDAMPPATPEIDLDAIARAPREQLARPVPIAPQPVVPGTTPAAPAAQVFAAAISAAYDSPSTPASRPTEPAIVQGQGAAEQLRTTVQAMSGAEQAPLDLSRDDWAGKMVDRIAALRDAAEAADTRIRLAPEHLGNVDVSIRREGDRLHVHFAADSPATRQLLAEAAPRLAELADSRGLKLGQTSVDAGTGGQQGTPNQPQSDQPLRRAPAATQASEADRDDRVA
ncbi:flagellar hook-length control protein FliK [Sphingomonas sp.]|uniref:flagellar hook-length control protein FliK n=1 Tax=Sphingomonas sp. TaxID=28214 RepID=UPI0031E48AE2